MAKLPPGQWVVDGFPRFGVDLSSPPPRARPGHRVEVVGLDGEVSVLPDLATLPRHAVTADFHCVSGWSSPGHHWEGVRLRDALAALAPVPSGAEPGYLLFEGLDRYRSIVTAEDALADDVLLADHLDGAPLPPEHGAPVRLLSPLQYGFVSVKHLRRIELHEREPRLRYHPARRAQLALRVVHPHRRARVWAEERHRYLPSWLVRRIYRQVVPRLAPRVRPRG